MDPLQVFPHLNALLNFLSGCCLVAGFYFIMTGRVRKHRASMIAAGTISALFLISYLAHHSLRTYYFGLGPTKFTGTGFMRPVYFTILTSHTVLAAVVAPFVIVTLRLALNGRFDQHRNMARLVFPVWLYVSVTGVLVYLILYHLYPNR